MAEHPEYASADEAAVALEKLGHADLVRLKKIAKVTQFRARGTSVDWEDLLQEAVTRVLEGTRRWPRHVPFITFLAGVMRSLASEIPRDVAEQDSQETAVSPNPGPERETAARERLRAIEALFADDDDGLAVMMANADGCSPREIQDMFQLTPTRYASTLTRIRRRLLQYQEEELINEPR